MKRLILVATVVLQECCFGCAYRIHTATESEIYRLLGHPAIQPLTKLAQQIHLLDVAAPCLVRSAQEEPEVLEAVQALRERSGLLKPIIKNVRDSHLQSIMHRFPFYNLLWLPIDCAHHWEARNRWKGGRRTCKTVKRKRRKSTPVCRPGTARIRSFSLHCILFDYFISIE